MAIVKPMFNHSKVMAKAGFQKWSIRTKYEVSIFNSSKAMAKVTVVHRHVDKVTKNNMPKNIQSTICPRTFNLRIQKGIYVLFIINNNAYHLIY